uniref:Integrase zinc-binding domain-containing protein n=1 Tax=Panagrolaimus sp. JU765 TaxID=591449 RepID=A0AC34R798_9BILA
MAAALDDLKIALKDAMKDSKPYFFPIPTFDGRVRTDNSPLKSLMDRKSLKGRLARFQIALMGKNLQLEYRPGKTNHFADYLSRYALDLPPKPKAIQDKWKNYVLDPENGLENQEKQMPSIGAVYQKPAVDIELIKQEQLTDETSRALYQFLVQGDVPSQPQEEKKLRKMAMKFKVINEILYYTGQSKRKKRVYIPTSLRQMIFDDFHHNIMQGAHLGTTKTLEKMQKRVYWPGFAEDIAERIRKCEICQKRKIQPFDKRAQPLQPLRTVD